MTKERTRHSFGNEVKAALVLSMALFFGITLSSEVSEYVKDGMLLAVRSVIPTSLPFMIVSDFYVCYGRPENIGVIRCAFTRLFGIGEYGIAPLISGNIGGFPIGVKMCAECYCRGMLTRTEAERLMPLSNNPSPAFVVGGVGMGIYGDTRVGILMLLSIYIATVLCGIITSGKREKTVISANNVNNRFDFVASVRSAGINSISIISFISVFSAICGIIKGHVKYAPLTYVSALFLEVTNAVKIYSAATVFSKEFGMILSAFALGFGGISVALQSAVFASLHGLRMRKYYLIKLLEGVLCAAVFSILYMI